jgi:hypothetical protein
MTDDIANHDDHAHKSQTLAPGLAGIVAIGRSYPCMSASIRITSMVCS